MQPSTPHHAIENESWDYVARALITFPIDIEPENPKLRRLRKELQVIRQALYEQLLSYNGNRTIDASFFVGSIKAITRIERGLESEGIKNQAFVLFLRLLLRRLRKHRLVVKKPMEKRCEFHRMKRFVEHADPL